MVELIEGKKYKIKSISKGDLYFHMSEKLVGRIMTLGAIRFDSCSFNAENGSGYYTLNNGFEVEECCEVPPRNAEAATMELEEQELDFRPLKRQFESGAVRDNNEGKPFVHSLMGYTRLRFGYHMSKNAKKYGENNFLLGIPSNVYLESIDRHLAQYMAGDRSEDHLSSLLFGVQGLMLNEEKDGIPADHFAK